MTESYVPPYKPLLALSDLTANMEDIENRYPTTGNTNIAPGTQEYIATLDWNNRYMDAHASMLEAVTDILDKNLNSPKKAVEVLREFMSERWAVQWDYEELYAPRVNFDIDKLEL